MKADRIIAAILASPSRLRVNRGASHTTLKASFRRERRGGLRSLFKVCARSPVPDRRRGPLLRMDHSIVQIVPPYDPERRQRSPDGRSF